MSIPHQSEPREDVDAFGRSVIERAYEPPEEVVFRTDQIDPYALQPEDLGILYHVLIRDPELPCSVVTLAEELKAYGWKGVSDKPLRQALRRLISAGHIERLRGNDPETGQVMWLFRVYRNPANNPQVKAIRSNQPDGPNGRSIHPVDSTISAGQAHPVENAGWAAIRSNRPDGDGNVSAGQPHPVENAGWSVSPPTPPLGGGNTTPYPHTRPAVSAETGTKGGEDQAHAPEKHTPDRLAAAADLLRGLTGDVALNSKRRADLAPLVLGLVDDDGWPLGPELLRALSVARDNAPVKNAASVVRSRIENLRPYQAPATGTPAAAASPGADVCPQHPHRLAVDCRPCRAGDADGAPVTWRTPRPLADPAAARARAMAEASAEHSRTAEAEAGDPSDEDPAAARARVEEIRRRTDRRPGTRAVQHPERRDTRVRRQRAADRAAAAEAEAEENRRKANELLGADPHPVDGAVPAE